MKHFYWSESNGTVVFNRLINSRWIFTHWIIELANKAIDELDVNINDEQKKKTEANDNWQEKLFPNKQPNFNKLHVSLWRKLLFFFIANGILLENETFSFHPLVPTILWHRIKVHFFFLSFPFQKWKAKTCTCEYLLISYSNLSLRFLRKMSILSVFYPFLFLDDFKIDKKKIKFEKNITNWTLKLLNVLANFFS